MNAAMQTIRVNGLGKRKTRAKKPVMPTREQVALWADHLWQQHGCPPTREWDYWLQAECQLRSVCLPRKAVTAAQLMILK